MQTLILTLIFLPLVALHAFIDSRLIKAGKNIEHFLESSIFAIVCFVSGSLFMPTIAGMVFTILGAITCRIGFFDFLLNVFRGLPLYYTSKTTGSVIDRFEQKTGINENVVRVAGILFYFAVIIFSLNQP